MPEIEAPETPEPATPKNNIDRLIIRLEKDSFAYRLVQAYRSGDPSDLVAPIKTVLRDHLHEAGGRDGNTKS
mgnify:CR=1 FL=1